MMGLEIFEYLLNISDLELRDAVIIAAAFLFLTSRVLMWLFKWVDSRNERNTQIAKAEREEQRHSKERYENFLTAELERVRGELTLSVKALAIAQSQQTVAQTELDEQHALVKRLWDRVKYLEKLLRRRGLNFKPFEIHNE